MGYNTSETPCIRMESYLRELFNHRKTLSWQSTNPKRLAYRLHEAIHAAKHHQRFRVYADLKAFYTIKAKPDSVIAIYNPAGEPTPLDTPTPTQPTFSISDPLSIQGIIGAAIRFPTHPEIYFSNPVITQEDLKKLHKWCSHNKWHILNHGDSGITLSKNPADPSLIWTPEN